MHILRLTQVPGNAGRHRVEITLEKDGQRTHTATSSFDFKLSAQDQEDLRWYL